MNNVYLSSSSKRVIKKLKELKDNCISREIHKLPVKEARKEFAKLRNYFTYKNQIEVLKIKNFNINNIPVRYYRGKKNSAIETLPIMIYFHGGGWVLGSLDTHDQVCRKLVENSKYDVISVGYNLAPETIFPVGIEECIKLVNCINKIDYGLKIDRDKIILCGDSAGGNFVSVICNQSKSFIKAQILIYPVTDMFNSYPSKNKYDGLILNKTLIEWFQNHYIPIKIRKKYYNDVRLSPIKKKKFSNIPNTFIVLAECDPLYDEGFLYGKKLEANNVQVKIKTYKGLMHGFLTMGGEIEEVNLVIQDINREISECL
tara:strand:+ start:1154 stop:2098 length:945 start_codon:yes stop_codon:yes gene_type:complete